MKTLQQKLHKNKLYTFKKSNFFDLNNFSPKMTFVKSRINTYENLIPIKNKNKSREKLCLVPISKLDKNKTKYRNNLINENGEINNNDYKKYNSTYNKNIYKKLKNIWKKRMNNIMLESKSDENDMKPKIRFINLKKDLMEQTLKINKMFIAFNKQIKEKEKNIRNIGKIRFKKKVENNNINNNI